MKVTKILVSELGRPNPNGRIYTAIEIQRAIEYIKHRIDSKHLLGEIGQPADTYVDLSRVSHVIDRLWIENNNLYADATLLETPRGLEAQQLFSLIPQQVKFGIRGYGMVNESSLVTELEIIAIDIVSNQLN